MTDKLFEIFLSHSAADQSLAGILKREIEKELNVQVFVSTEATSIRSGDDGLPNVINALKACKVLIILGSDLAFSSVWVAFEFGFGYAWRDVDDDKKKKNVHILKFPYTQEITPFSIIQSKNVTSTDGLKAFFKSLCEDFGQTFKGEADLDAIAQSAKSIPVPPPERSLARFEKYLETPQKWEKAIIRDEEIWLYTDDVFYQITSEPEYEYNRKPVRMSIKSETWLQKFHEPKKNRTYSVLLKIAGTPVRDFRYVSIEGGRYIVPLPEPDVSSGVMRYFWSRNSLEFKISRIVGVFYYYSLPEEFAERAEIEIRD